MPIEQLVALSNIALTAGLLLFAGMQWWVTHASERNRRDERIEDQKAAQREHEREQDRAFQIGWAEQFRLEALANDWDTADLVYRSALGVLRASDVLPKDWSVLVQSLGSLSVEAGYLGGVSMTLAHDLEREIATLNGLVDGYRVQFSNQSPEELSDLVRHNCAAEAKDLEARIRHKTRDLAHLLWDAVRHSPRADVDRTLEFKDELWSRAARAGIEALQHRQIPEGKPTA